LSDLEQEWHNTLKKVCEYMDQEKVSPKNNDKNPDIKKLGSWICNQKQNYKKNVNIMANNPDVRAEWEKTVEKYKEYLCDTDQIWYNTLKKVCDYMDKEKQSPRKADKNSDIKKLGKWIGTQKTNYKKNVNIMATNPDVKIEWKKTVEKYKEYLCIDLEQDWYNTLKKVCDYMDKEKQSPTIDKNPDIKTLGYWVCHQKQNYNKNVKIMATNPDIKIEWERTVEKYKEYLVIDLEQDWYNTLKKVCDYMDKEKQSPRSVDKNPEIKILGSWVCHQKTNYKKNIGTVTTNPDVKIEWEKTVEKYKEYLDPTEKQTPKKQTTIPPETTSTSSTQHHFQPPSDIGILHKTYLRMRSDTLNQKFKSDPKLWKDYHTTRKQTFAKYEPDSIPTNKIIKELDKIRTKRQKIVVDMGCGEAHIAHHFQKGKDTRFIFNNYDHQSGGDPIINEVDITSLPLQNNSVEIAIMSLALWGTQENCKQYIKEAHRVLESGGKFYISDSTKKWSLEPLTTENGGSLLRLLLIDNGFTIISEDIGLPFCLFVCNKVY
jgi:uncharacterized protein (DUF736 family)